MFELSNREVHTMWIIYYYSEYNNNIKNDVKVQVGRYVERGCGANLRKTLQDLICVEIPVVKQEGILYGQLGTIFFNLCWKVIQVGTYNIASYFPPILN